MGRRAAAPAVPRHPRSITAVPSKGAVFGLLVLNAFLPGAVHFLRGPRKLRWLFLGIAALIWAAGSYLILSSLTSRVWLFNLVTHPVASMVLIIGLLVVSAWYLFSFIDVLRLIRFPKLNGGMKAAVIVVLVPLLVLTSGSTAYAAYLLNVGRNALGDIFSASQSLGPDKSYTKPSLNPINGRYNILMMGGDAGSDRVGRRPDSIMAISVDAETGATLTVSIPRNLQNAPFPDDSPMKAALTTGDGVDGTDGAFNCGNECIIGNLYSKVNEKYSSLYPGVGDPGGQAMLETVSAILGIKMQAYVIADMDQFSQLIDLMGGVKINAGNWVPISGEALDNVGGGHKPPEGWIAPGEQTLSGYQALWYARSREWVNDYARNQRQQCVVQAMIKQMNPLTLFTKFTEIVKAGTKIIESDITTAQIGSFIDLALKSQSQPVKKLILGPPDLVSDVPGQTDFPTYPDFKLSQQKVAQLLGKTATTGTTPPSSSAPPASNGTTPPSPPASSSSPGTPSNTPSKPPGPPITKEYLQGLAVAAYNGDAGAKDTLVGLLANNGACTPG
ncbi:LCP family protein [Psychromicrobium sp. YIM B11713]|uniref:LCP family protein n=1 Tax=Psychromicrobium sp. YIM B11713 TaxID=3145233 RepID=UPI00374F1345